NPTQCWPAARASRAMSSARWATWPAACSAACSAATRTSARPSSTDKDTEARRKISRSSFAPPRVFGSEPPATAGGSDFKPRSHCVVTFQLTIERRKINAEDVGGAGLVLVDGGERLKQVATLDIGERGAQAIGVAHGQR